ncbi:putative beta-barrel assembly-enhancing protease [Marinobacterium zhoushanense]|uniref:Putative beta-barrel assembly-enhancing protease n=1 Tax=Marinobacterium zhoushanense TaxID=1679163 RepID=A0ABQ1KMM3_9GAMM|nr:M48 family metalloprotease [Marinobacterium zhoushanense]GGC02535.1 putative beta-barrel assembly-enhancing protease [Marinobacterium zhoushanense]
MALILAQPFQTAVAEPSLPVLTDSTSSTISLEQEYRLGRSWVRTLRGQAKLLNDPIVKQYLHDLLWAIVPNSQLTDRRLELVVLDNANLNAFAVPGGVIGINGGLITAAESEAETASVIAHELAHLSQRHYAQQLEESRRNRPLVLAGLLASILVASADSQAGTAAISTTLAGSIASQLAFSRRNEQEADRIGMQTLVASGYDPYAMPGMFSRLQKNYRFAGQRAPEFLLTHPVTESRIADSLNRASSLPRPHNLHTSFLYDLVRQRLRVHYSQNLEQLHAQFSADAKQENRPLNQYGRLLTATALNKLSQAEEALSTLPKEWRQHPYVRLSELDLLQARGKNQDALALAEELVALYPDSMPVRYRYALSARLVGQYQRAAEAFRRLTSDYPNDVDFWYQLAETEGLNGQINAVHLARIEYFMLTGQMDLALRQVEFARREPGLGHIDKSRLDQKEEEIKALRQQMKEDLS